MEHQNQSPNPGRRRAESPCKLLTYFVSFINSGGSGADSTSSLDNAARAYRNGTALYDASCTWSGQLPQRIMRGAVLSCKVFLGGVPWDITESALFTAFKMYGPIRIEWPGKDNSTIPKGYLYVIFENDKQVSNIRFQPCLIFFCMMRNTIAKEVP